MAETAGAVITSALGELLVRASEAPLEPDEIQDAITYLNRMMNAFAVGPDGINIGYTNVSSTGDEVTVPDGALEGIVKNLAIKLQPQFGSPDTPINLLLIQGAAQGLETLRAIAIESIGPTQFPSSLPFGSGNEGNDIFAADHFYHESNDPVLTEQAAFISVEEDTELP